jgi:hypothetical protein
VQTLLLKSYPSLFLLNIAHKNVKNVLVACQVVCTMQCSAAMPWPMQGTVEAAMVQEGKVTVGKVGSGAFPVHSALH